MSEEDRTSRSAAAMSISAAASAPDAAPGAPIRLLIADDHPLFRDGLRALIDSIEDVELVGEAGSGEEAIAQALALVPDVLLMDIHMPAPTGIEATRRIVRAAPSVRVLMLTMLEDDDSVFAALRAGAQGYLLKGARQAEILRAIRAVADGGVIFGPGIAARVAGYFASMQHRPPAPQFPELSPRELEVLDLLARRASNAEIAERLVISPKTVRNHVSNVLHKLQVADRTEAMLAARAAGMGEGQAVGGGGSGGAGGAG